MLLPVNSPRAQLHVLTRKLQGEPYVRRGCRQACFSRQLVFAGLLATPVEVMEPLTSADTRPLCLINDLEHARVCQEIVPDSCRGVGELASLGQDLVGRDSCGFQPQLGLVDVEGEPRGS